MLPPSGWLGTTDDAATVTRFPLPAPIMGGYQLGDVGRGRPAPAPELVVHSAGGTRASATATIALGLRRAHRVELRMEEAFGVLLVDRVALERVGWDRCGARPAPSLEPCGGRPGDGS